MLNVRSSALAAAFVLAACQPSSPKPDATPPPPAAPQLATVGATAPPPEDFAAAEQAPAGQPNLRVCLPAYLDKSDWPPVTLPAAVVFESAGRKVGDEREPGIDRAASSAVHYALVSMKPVTLSKAQPCAEVAAQTARSNIYAWTRPLVRRSQDLQFRAIGIENQMAFPRQDRVGAMIKGGQIYAYPSGDIGHPRALREEG